jgi:hypothetical protein
MAHCRDLNEGIPKHLPLLLRAMQRRRYLKGAILTTGPYSAVSIDHWSIYRHKRLRRYIDQWSI